MATDPRVETIRLLTSIDTTLRKMLALQSAVLHSDTAAPSPAVDDAVANGPYGDPLIKAKSPRDWSGDDMTGRHFSECPPEYLDLLADRFDYFAGKEPDPTKANYNRLDAKRARAWAARIRNGYQSPAADAAEPGF